MMRFASREEDNPRRHADRPGSAVRSAGRPISHVLLSVVCGVMLVLLGCSLPEGDAESNPPERVARTASNRLSRESSPYLLLHAQNPVDWYPWGPEALEKARKEDKPIFLSIGYSSCHWCHVMEKSVFSDPEIARYMNEHFINIKVDREERPDIDEIYMLALQMYFHAIGSPQTGGWPLSIFLTPDGRPLGGGTYFPPNDEQGRTGFPTLMRKVFEAWRDKRREMDSNADFLAERVRQASRLEAAGEPAKLDRALLTPVLKNLEATYDSEYGGFGFDRRSPDRPKFPVPVKLALLQYEAKRHANEQAGKMLFHTLDRMAAGGIYDHVGGGFHRYSTDRFWRVPHFEKMLYDNAQLADVYAEAYRQSGQTAYRDVAEGIIEFVSREMTDAKGGFYSALDADSEGLEGKYYVWTDEQLAAVLTPREREICQVVYGATGESNFELGRVLEQVESIDEAAKKLKMPALELDRALGALRAKLLTARIKRPAPARDDKILTSWNGLMIRALARAGVIFEKPEYVRDAARAAEFILAEMRDEKGNLLRSYRAGKAHVPAYLDDYAFLVDGLLALHLATGEERWANAAQRLSDQQLALFWDETGKGCYFTADTHESLLARTKNATDSVIPSGNSVTARNLVRLASITKKPDYRTRAQECLGAFIPVMQQHPGGLPNLALAISEYLDTNEPAGARSESPRPRVGIAPDGDIVLAAAQREAAPEPKAKKKPEVVTGKAFLSVDKLPPGGKANVLIQLDMAAGWHIHANPPGDTEFDIATDFEIASELGTELTRKRFPTGKKESRGKDEKPLLVYEGQVNLLGILEVPADAAGGQEELTIEVTYQACNDRECQPPKKLKLTLPVQVAKKGEAVKPANEKLFAPPAKKAATPKR